MIELMVVIGVMVVLAGFIIAALPGVMANVNRNRVKTFLAELEDGLSKYQIDNGIYPLNEPGGDRDKDGVKGAAVLYKHLSGDFDLDGEVDFQKNEKVYVQKLDYFSNRDAKEARSAVVNGEYMVMDSFGDPIRYLAQPPNLKSEKDRKTRNPTYDLWSIAGEDPNDSASEAAYISNWQAK